LKTLTAETTINIRFGETDAMGVVWHGNYLKYFEDAREAFGATHNMAYLDFYNAGYFTPIVKSEVDYKSPIHYGEKARIITRLIYAPAAKIIFEYEIINLNTNKVSATGKTIQIFLNAATRELEINKPEFYKAWEKQAGLL
jgi:acyl-CoA thioester hydrolase